MIMSSWTYIHSETGWTNEDGEYIPGLWTVGHSDAAGSWHPESEHDDPEAAAARVHWLNGGGPNGSRDLTEEQVRDLAENAVRLYRENREQHGMSEALATEVAAGEIIDGLFTGIVSDHR
jgi:hypothetical protein